jgi:hypothetical protein
MKKEAKKAPSGDPTALVRAVAVPVLGVVRISASTEEELRQRLAELREASLDW